MPGEVEKKLFFWDHNETLRQITDVAKMKSYCIDARTKEGVTLLENELERVACEGKVVVSLPGEARRPNSSFSLFIIL